MDADHVHRFNATILTHPSEPVLRCACGAWSSRARIRDGAPPYSGSYAKGLESRLAKARAWENEGGRWPEAEARHNAYEPATTPDVCQVLDGKRRDPHAR